MWAMRNGSRSQVLTPRVELLPQRWRGLGVTTRVALLGVLVASALSLSQAARAGSIVSNVDFVVTDQSIWGNTGPLPITNAYPGPQFFGIDESIWNFGNPTPVPSSLYVGGYTSGHVGIAVDFQFDSGTFDAIVPYSAGLSFSYAQFNAAAGPAMIQTEALLRNDAFLQTRSPDLRLGADLSFGMSAGLYGGGCVNAWLVSGCASFNESFTVPDTRIELIALNRNGDGEFRLLPSVQDFLQLRADRAETWKRLDKGEKAADEKNPDGTTKNNRQRIEARLKALVKVGVGLPDLASADVVLPELGTSGGAVGGVIKTARAEDNFLNLELDVDGVLTSLGIIPPLEVQGTLDAALIAQGSFSANLADITLKPSLTLAEQFSLTPALEMDLQLSRPMQVTVGGVTQTTDHISGLAAGLDSFLLQWDDGTPLFVTPTYRLSSAAFVNDLDLGLDLSLNMKLLSAAAQLEILGIDLPKLGFGPLVNADFNLEGVLAPGAEGFGYLDLKQWEFEVEALKALSFVGDPITLFPAQATLVGSSGGGLWSNTANWVNGVVGDSGNAIVIGDVFARISASDGGADHIVEVGNLAIAPRTGFRGLFITSGGRLTQANGATTFSNEGYVEVQTGGIVTVAAPINAGGRINVAGGTLQGPIDLNGQKLELNYDGVVNAQGKLDIDGLSSLVANSTGTVNVTGSNPVHNAGTISAPLNGAVLNLHGENTIGRLEIDNAGGVIAAAAGGRVLLSHVNPSNPTAAGTVKITGGVLRTDANPNSAIESSSSRVWLDGVTNEGTFIAHDTLFLDGTITNDGNITAQASIFADPAYTHYDVPTELLGTGVLNLQAGNLLYSPGPTTLVNGPEHTISGAGQIGSHNFTSLSVENRGTISATGGTLTVEAISGLARSFINAGGTLEAGTGGGLLLNTGEYDLADGLVHARGGNVTFTSAAQILGGATTGPGGVFEVDANRTLTFQNAAAQWASLAGGEIRGGEIILNGNNSDVVVNTKSLRNGSQSARLGLSKVGDMGTLRLVDTTLDLSSYLVIPGSTSTAAQIQIANGGTLVLDNATLKTRADIDLLGSSGAGTLTVLANALVVGHGTIDSDGVQNGGGTIRAEGGTLIVDAALIGSGRYETTPGANLQVDLGTCTLIFGITCPFTRVLSAEGELAGNTFVVRSGALAGEASTFTLLGANANPFVEKLSNSRIELAGPQSSVRMFSPQQGTKFLDQTLTSIANYGALVLSEGKQFFSTTPSLALLNHASLDLVDAGTRYAGPALNVDPTSNVNLRGGVLDVDALTVQDGANVNGFGLITNSVIGNAGNILVDNGELEIKNSTVNQDGPTGLRRITVSAVDIAATEPDPASILRLTGTQVNGGLVAVLDRALLTGNGTFYWSAVYNFGTILAGAVGGSNATTTFYETPLTNFESGVVTVSDSTLALWGADSVVTNFGGATSTARIDVFSAATDSANTLLDIRGGQINYGYLDLRSEPLVSFESPVIPSDPDQRIESAPPTIAILNGYGTLANVNVTIDAFSLVDASVEGERLVFDIGTGSIENAGIMQASSGGILTLRNGVMTGAGDVIAQGSSIVEIQNMDFQGANLTTNADGIIRDIGTSTFRNLTNDGVFEVSSTGHVTLAGNVTNTNDATSVIHAKSGGVIDLADGGTTPDGDPVPFALNGGTLSLDAGATVLGNGQTLSARGAVLTGNGRIEADVFLDGNSDLGTVGTLRPGNSPGVLDFIGDVTLGALNELEIEIGGLVRTTEYDWINVSGTLTLGGTLNVVLYDLGQGLFNPTLGDTFDILDAALITGMFAEGGISLPALDGGLVWDVSLLTVDGVISVAAVPLPEALWMFLAALAASVPISRRRFKGTQY